MAKITKKAEILDTLHKLVTKEAELAQTNVSGVPGTDTKVTSISESTETTNKNDVGPEKLNDEQGYEQKPTDDGSEPLAGAKQASEQDPINKLANDILATINNKLAAQAQTGISGKPGKDTKVTSISDSTETTDKNDVGPEKLNGEQGYEQKPTTDSSEPLKGAKKAEDLSKEASYVAGAKFADFLMQKTAEAKKLQDKQAEAEMLKEAGRRDFDTLIAQAAAELETQQANDVEYEKQAEAQGAFAFDELLKQAQFEAVVEENNLLRAKLAEYQELEQEVLAKEAAVKEEEKLSKMASLAATLVFEKLKNDLQSTTQAAK